MDNPFANAAATYDEVFTHSALGRAQRDQVWRHLEPLLARPPLQVLELNCGTGIDAMHIAKAGHHVLATDSSDEMLRAATNNVADGTPRGSLHFERMTFDELASRGWKARFDLVLSDLGGLNCISDDALAGLCDPLAEALVPKGRCVAVIMPDRSVVESMYFLMRGRAGSAFRRWKQGPIDAHVAGTTVPTWYHSPRSVMRAFAPRFRVLKIRPIGFFVPPGYLEPRFRKNHRAVRWLGRADANIAGQRWMARLADHFLIDLERTR